LRRQWGPDFGARERLGWIGAGECRRRCGKCRRRFGLVVAGLDEEGAVLGEKVLAEPAAGSVRTSFSKNGEHVLFAFAQSSAMQAWYGVFDLQGTLLGDLKPLSEDSTRQPLALAVTPHGDGWLVASDLAVSNKAGVRLTKISKDGLVMSEQKVLSGYPSFFEFTPSAYGGVLLLGTLETSGQTGAISPLMARIDDNGAVVYSEIPEFDETESWPLAVIHDPQRDLVIKASQFEASLGTIFVQEYGCLP
jgi:hypothetical protein